MNRTRRLALRRETLAEISTAQLAAALVAAGDESSLGCSDLCFEVHTISRCYTTPLYQTCWACG